MKAIQRRPLVRAAQGLVLAVGAPVGWLLIRMARGHLPMAELSANASLYAYMLFATMVVFGLFGLLLGEREARLLRLNKELEHASVTDALTGLRNARYFYTRLAEEFAEWQRTGQPLGLVIIDLDHFKRVNDEHGHPVGDAVLVNTARAIASVTRQHETEARVGGEEFALLLPGSNSEQAREVAERARMAIAESTTQLPAGGVIYVTASAGVASTAELPDATPAWLYRAADEALYEAKEGGRDRTCVAALKRSQKIES